MANDLHEEALARACAYLREGGATVVEMVGDVSSEEDARAMAALAVKEFGRLDVLVANAGVIVLGTLEETTAEDWDAGSADRTRSREPSSSSPATTPASSPGTSSRSTAATSRSDRPQGCAHR